MGLHFPGQARSEWSSTYGANLFWIKSGQASRMDGVIPVRFSYQYLFSVGTMADTPFLSLTVLLYFQKVPTSMIKILCVIIKKNGFYYVWM